MAWLISKWRIYSQFCIKIQPGSSLKANIHFYLMSPDELVDQDLDGNAAAQYDPGPEGKTLLHIHLQTLQKEVQRLQDNDEQGDQTDVPAALQSVFPQVVGAGHEGEGDADQVEGEEGHVGIRHETQLLLDGVETLCVWLTLSFEMKQ